MSISEPDLARLIAAVDASDYASALGLCRERLEQWPAEPDWQLQLGLVHFLDDMNPDWYSLPIPALREAVALESSVSARFWLAYALLIIDFEPKMTDAESILRSVLADEPDHPLANVVLAGGVAGHEESIEALFRTLRVQPNNRRALTELSKLLITDNRTEEARHLLSRAIDEPPYVETSAGIMNRYVSEVLCGAASVYDAKELLSKLEA